MIGYNQEEEEKIEIPVVAITNGEIIDPEQRGRILLICAKTGFSLFYFGPHHRMSATRTVANKSHFVQSRKLIYLRLQ